MPSIPFGPQKRYSPFLPPKTVGISLVSAILAAFSENINFSLDFSDINVNLKQWLT